MRSLNLTHFIPCISRIFWTHRTFLGMCGMRMSGQKPQRIGRVVEWQVMSGLLLVKQTGVRLIYLNYMYGTFQSCHGKCLSENVIWGKFMKLYIIEGYGELDNIYIYIYIHMHISMSIYVCMYICVYIYTYIWALYGCVNIAYISNMISNRWFLLVLWDVVNVLACGKSLWNRRGFWFMQMLPFLVAYTLALVLFCRLALIPYPSYSLVARELWQCSVHWLDDHIIILSQWFSLDPNIRFVVDTTLSTSPFSFSWQAIAALGPQLWKHWRQQTARITLSVSVASTILTLIRRLSPQRDVSVTVASVYDSLDAIRNAPMTDMGTNDAIRTLVLDLYIFFVHSLTLWKRCLGCLGCLLNVPLAGLSMKASLLRCMRLYA